MFQLFDHIAECLANFMSENDVFTEKLPLGFTFSFPLEQVGLTKGILKTWTKGFSCSGVVGQDVVSHLEDAIQRRGVRIISILYLARLSLRLVVTFLFKSKCMIFLSPNIANFLGMSHNDSVTMMLCYPTHLYTFISSATNPNMF